jgi:PEGA domain
MKYSILRPFVISFVLMMIFSARYEIAGQKRQKQTVKPPVTKPQEPGSPPRQRNTYRNNQVKVITKRDYARVLVNPKPNIGYLSVVANPSTIVTLTSLPEDGKRATVRQTIKAGNNTIYLGNLSPGKYKILLEHEEYQPFTDTIQIEKASPLTYVALDKMESRYGTVHTAGIPQGAKVYWDDKAIIFPISSRENPDELIKKLLKKVPVGKHKLKVSKAGFLDIEKEIDVLPGQEAFEPVSLAVAIAPLNLRSQPGSVVYVDDEYKGITHLDGKLTIQLIPGPHKIRVSKEGFQEWVRDLTISDTNNPTSLDVSLLRIPDSAEGHWEPANRENKWYPRNFGWIFDKKGAVIRGDKLALFDTELNSDFNHYQNVKLEFDVVFNNGKGVAWVARAKDLNNYYLFELTGPKSGTLALNFYICVDGRLNLKNSQSVHEDMDAKDEIFHIIFTAQGNKFETRMEIYSAPLDKPRWLGVFTDNTFSIGGIGFRGKDQSEVLLQSLFINPQ